MSLERNRIKKRNNDWSEHNETYNYICGISNFKGHLQISKNRKCVRQWRTYFYQKVEEKIEILHRHSKKG